MSKMLRSCAMLFQVASGSEDVARTFFVFLYNDRFTSQVIYCWKMTVNFIQKIDVCCTQGQTCRTSLILRSVSHSFAF